MNQLKRDLQGLKTQQLSGKFVDNSESQTDYNQFNVIIYSNDKSIQKKIKSNDYETDVNLLLKDKILKDQKINFDANKEEINDKITKF